MLRPSTLCCEHHRIDVNQRFIANFNENIIIRYFMKIGKYFHLRKQTSMNIQ